MRLRGAIAFSEDLTDPAQDHAAIAKVREHPEAPLLAYVIREFTQWLLELAEQGAESETDEFVMMAGSSSSTAWRTLKSRAFLIERLL